MATLKIVKGELPEKKNQISKQSMINYVVEYGTTEDLEWLENQYKTVLKSQILYYKNGQPEAKVPDTAKIRDNFLNKFFAEELKAKKESKKSKKEDPFAIAKKRMAEKNA